MKVKIQQFLFGGQLLSWSIVGQEIGRSLIKLGHTVDFISTDGVDSKYTPEDLKPYIKEKNNLNYDLSLSYTAMHNFPNYLNGGKVKLGIYNYDSAPQIPSNMVKYYNSCNKLLPSSDFSRQVFINSKIPADHLITVPHGINLEDFEDKEKFNLKTKAGKKILVNIASPHLRKNIKGIFEVYGKAFDNKDNVCLIFKINPIKPKHPFDVDFYSLLADFKKKFKNHAEIEIIAGHIEYKEMIKLYNVCDICFSMSNTEMFHMSSLEGLAAGKIIVAPRYGGQLHFLNDDNSLLIDSKIIRMPREFQYWQSSSANEMCEPSINDAIEKLKLAVNSYDALAERFKPSFKETVDKHAWVEIAKSIESIVDNLA